MTNDITAIIPTRAGSERVVNKNVRPFAETTLLEVKAKMILKLFNIGLIDDLVVNSNCPDSKKIADKLGIRFIQREDYFASSECDIRDYWVNVTENIQTRNFMLCQVTSPLISYTTYEKCINQFINNKKSILTIKKLKEYLWKKNTPINYNFPSHPRSQNLPDDIYFLNFGICIMPVKEMKRYRNLVVPDTEFYALDDIESIDIDTQFDFDFAEYLFLKKEQPTV